MKLQKLIGVDQVHLDLEAADVETALAVVARTIADGIGLGQGRIIDALMERERLGSTSVGDRFAIPHCKLPGLKEISIALCRFRDGVEFGSADGSAVKFFFVVLSPPDQPAAHLQVLSQIARVLKHRHLRNELLEAESAVDVVEVIRRVSEAEGL